MRVGIFGGTFDPVHHGHIHAVSYAREMADLDLIYVMVAGDPYHKAVPGVPASQRFEWTRKAFEEYFRGDLAIVVDDREITRQGATYTIDTLREVKDEHENDTLVLIVGEDIPAQMSNWKEGNEIAMLAEIFIVPRTQFPTSSSEIRALVTQKKPITGLLPAAIEAEILTNSLYNEVQ